MTTYSVHCRLGQDLFEDILVEARTEADAIAKAKKLTSFKSIWTRFII